MVGAVRAGAVGAVAVLRSWQSHLRGRRSAPAKRGVAACGLPLCIIWRMAADRDGRWLCRLRVRILSVRAPAQQHIGHLAPSDSVRIKFVWCRSRQDFHPAQPTCAGLTNIIARSKSRKRVWNRLPLIMPRTGILHSPPITAATAILPLGAFHHRGAPPCSCIEPECPVRVISAGRVKVNSTGDPVAIGEST